MIKLILRYNFWHCIFNLNQNLPMIKFSAKAIFKIFFIYLHYSKQFKWIKKRSDFPNLYLLNIIKAAFIGSTISRNSGSPRSNQAMRNIVDAQVTNHAMRVNKGWLRVYTV